MYGYECRFSMTTQKYPIDMLPTKKLSCKLPYYMYIYKGSIQSARVQK